ncbi:hypothetical protein MTR72_38255 [Bradyrhizobium sp. ISRA442]|uniref:hypothetical protein n=1 Tax=Bradyrhizobium sp. ISRA442 TaxID=2866197 RepID=UPI00311ACE4D
MLSNADALLLLQGLNREKLAIDVDRLDYTKGLDNRVRAIDHLLNEEPRSISPFADRDHLTIRHQELR